MLNNILVHTVRVWLLCLILVGCQQSAPATPPPIEAIIADVPQVIRPPERPAPLVSQAAVDLIIGFEISSEALYNRRYRTPIWPGHASGLTWCIGYDAGYNSKDDIQRTWVNHEHVERLSQAAGKRRKAAMVLVPLYRDVETDFSYCKDVFMNDTLIEYEARTRRAFRNGYALLRPNAKGALVSVVYNRGASMVGDRRREMRVIRDKCVPNQDYPCIAAQIRSMKRLWTSRGLRKRRDAEARLVETP